MADPGYGKDGGPPPAYSGQGPQGQYPPPQGQYPPTQGQYPPPQGQYPPPQGQYPSPQGQYPPPQGQYPQQPVGVAPGTVVVTQPGPTVIVHGNVCGICKVGQF